MSEEKRFVRVGETERHYRQLQEERLLRLQEVRKEIVELRREEKYIRDRLDRKRAERKHLMRQVSEPPMGQSISNGSADPLAVAASELGRYIEAWRGKRNGNADYTLGVLSRRTGVSRRRLYSIQKGEQKFVTLAVADRILLALGLNEDVDVQVVPNPYYRGSKLRQGCEQDEAE